MPRDNGRGRTYRELIQAEYEQMMRQMLEEESERRRRYEVAQAQAAAFNARASAQSQAIQYGQAISSINIPEAGVITNEPTPPEYITGGGAGGIGYSASDLEVNPSPYSVRYEPNPFFSERYQSSAGMWGAIFEKPKKKKKRSHLPSWW